MHREGIMKKIGLMTWFNYQNFGTALQCTALDYVIRNMGYSTEIINYTRTHRYVGKKNGSFVAIMKIIIDKIKISVFLKPYYNKEREKLFKEYIDSLLIKTEKCSTSSELRQLNKYFDAFVCGSDQIWSPLCFDENYFLSFVNSGSRMVSYAPSFGVTSILDKEIKLKISRLLVKFKNLSVREKAGAEIVEDLIGKYAEVVLDPTLLLNSKDWDSFIGSCDKKINREYIICYYLGDYRRYVNLEKKLSEYLGLPVYVIPTYEGQKENSVPFEVGPIEFVSLIKNAKYVLTDSYHGMLFAINYNIPFYVFPRFKAKDKANQNSRILSLLSILSLEDRMLDINNKNSKDFIIDDCVICYNVINDKIEKMRKKSIEYLWRSLRDSVQDNKYCEKNIIKITEKCCGCGACASACSKGAIKIILNEEGFQHYKIDNSLCIKCGICKSICPMNDIVAHKIKDSHGLYSFKYNDKNVLKYSSSGGAAHAIADYYNNDGYYICGVIYNTNTEEAQHKIVFPKDKKSILNFQGSKYLQSISAKAIDDVCKMSKTSKIVFFGTPCQVAGLDKLLLFKGNRENVLLIDLICHGVPTRYLFLNYLNKIKKNMGIDKKTNVIFRDGGSSWRNRHICVKSEDKYYLKSEKKDAFYRFFRRSLCNSLSCYDCPYREKSAADIRIGDYWGNKFYKDKTGVTMMIVNSDRGVKICNNLEKLDLVIMNRQKLEEYWSVQYPYNPSEPLFRKELIYKLQNNSNDIESLASEYCRWYDVKEFLSYIKNSLIIW